MNDTSENIQRMYDSMFACLSPGERAQKGCSMHDSSKEIVMSQITTPEKTRGDIMAELFLRFYAEDIPEQSLQRILKAIKQHHLEGPA